MNRTIFRHRQATGFFGLVAAAVLLVATASLAQAQQADMPSFGRLRRATGNWSNSTNWSTTGQVPVNGVNTVIDNGGTANIDATDGQLQAGYAVLGHTCHGTGTVNWHRHPGPDRRRRLSHDGPYLRVAPRPGSWILHPIRWVVMPYTQYNSPTGSSQQLQVGGQPASFGAVHPERRLEVNDVFVA